MSRAPLVAIVAAVVLALGGVALAGGDEGMPAATAALSARERVYTVDDAGSVTLAFDGSIITLVDIHANPGWSATVDSETDREVEVDFVQGARRLRFRAQVEAGGVRADVEDRSRLAPASTTPPVPAPTAPTTTPTTASTVPSPTTAATTPTTAPPTPPTTGVRADDRSGHDGPGDDRSGREAGGDRSGPGGGDGRVETFLGLEVGRRTLDVPGVGSVTVDVTAGGLAYVSASGASGWTPRVDEAGPHEVEVEFVSAGRVVDVSIEIEDGSLRLRVEEDD